MPLLHPLNSSWPIVASQFREWQNLQGAAVSLVLSRYYQKAEGPLLVITPDSQTAELLRHELLFFTDYQLPLLLFPDWEILPYDHFSPHQDIISERLTVLHQLPKFHQGIVIIPVTTLMQRLPPLDFLTARVFLLKKGDRLNLATTRQRLEKGGYRAVTQVQEHGEFAIRGAILDLYPMGAKMPYRIDLFDDEIDSIRLFSSDTQRSSPEQILEAIQLLPAKEFPTDETAIDRFRQKFRALFAGNPLNSPLYQEVSEGIMPPGIEFYFPLFFETTMSLFDYLPSSSSVFTFGDIRFPSHAFWQEIVTRHQQHRHDISRPLLPPEDLFFTVDQLQQQLSLRAPIVLNTTPLDTTLLDNEAAAQQCCVFNVSSPFNVTISDSIPQPLQRLQQFLDHHITRILFCAESRGRQEVLLQLLSTLKIRPREYQHWSDFLNDQSPYGITVAPLEQGIQLINPTISIIAESELYGKRVMQRRRRKTSNQDLDLMIRDLAELAINDPVVHIEHGVGRYIGLQTLNIGGADAEFLTLAYADNTKLYVPVMSLHLISRYLGPDPEHAPLNKLGTDQWQRTKQKALEQVRDVAAELLELYAKRAAQPGHAATIPESYQAFAAAFPFEETPDQQQAIENIIADLTADKPMDRLICGDVGFGKTEVAMRAAFIVAHNNKQVAVLVPTTLLAEQHFHTFRDRFAAWPVVIECLSRFKTVKEQRATIDKLQAGQIDIIIGTHKLLQDGIHFKQLGLVIIDEEHRFGVRQKERLKALRANVDILALTATPIPRTLNMALLHLRDLSLIVTAPARRLSIKTFVYEYRTEIIREAIQREILRGGQVYFLHNDIDTIQRITQDIAQLVPEAKTHFAHGQMHERELEKIMSDFYHRRFNVLVCTTIIESGIDIPSANTIIINRADKLGLAQLHQLRGRVGRSHHQAYAYLLTPPRQALTADAEKRLDSIASLEELGLGFTLATHDLEIRGAGELLGEGQSGNMQAIGFTLYMDLLAQAIDALKSGQTLEPELITHPAIEIDLQMPALIPESYLADIHLRLQCYKRIASAKTPSELDAIQVEMIDRFGLLPQPVKNLFAQSSLKFIAKKLGIRKIESHAEGGRIHFLDQPQINPATIIRLIQTHTKQFKLDGPTRLRFYWPEAVLPEARVKRVAEALQLLSEE